MAEILKLRKKIMDGDAEKNLQAQFLKEENLRYKITNDTDAYDFATGKLLFRFRKSVLDKQKQWDAYNSVEKAIDLTDGRGTASGGNKARVRKDGTVGKMMFGEKVEAGLLGFFDRNGKQPYCRKTFFTKKHFEQYEKALPFIREVNERFAELIPDKYKLQKMMADQTNKNYVIPETAFTTVTINRNFQTAVHKDAGDFEQGFGNLSVVDDGNYSGCYFTLPQWECGIDIRTGDLLLVDVHQFHGNTEFVPKNKDGKYLRVSFVMYYRQNMIQCLQPAEELKRIQQLKSNFNE